MSNGPTDTVKILFLQSVNDSHPSYYGSLWGRDYPNDFADMEHDCQKVLDEVGGGTMFWISQTYNFES